MDFDERLIQLWYVLPECSWVFLPKLWINEHNLIVDDGPENLQALDIQFITSLTLQVIFTLQLAEWNSKEHTRWRWGKK